MKKTFRTSSIQKNVEQALKSEKYALTCLRAGIIVGSGSASFEIIRDLVRNCRLWWSKWLKTKCQPIAIRNVIQFLTKVIGVEKPTIKTTILQVKMFLLIKKCCFNTPKLEV